MTLSDGEVSLEETPWRECTGCGWYGEEDEYGFTAVYGWWKCGYCSDVGQIAGWEHGDGKLDY